MHEYDAIVVGAGFSGAVMAERMATQLGYKVLVLEKRPHLAGNCYDEIDENGIMVHKYGPHLFHTDKNEVIDYLSNFTEWLPYQHKVLASINEKLVPIPFNFKSIDLCFDEETAKKIKGKLLSIYGEGTRVPILELRKKNDGLMNQLASYVFENIFINYTTKQWGVGPDEISPEVTARVPVVVGYDDRYFLDPFQAVPKYGYTKLISGILSHKNITLLQSTPMDKLVTLDSVTKSIFFNAEVFQGKLIYTGMLDELFSFSKGFLPYRSLEFRFERLSAEYFQPAATVNYPNSEKFTRITEFKRILDTKSDKTTIVYEYPCEYSYDSDLQPYYPIFSETSKVHFVKYEEMLKMYQNVIAVGRLAQYKYFDMDDAVFNALTAYSTNFEKK